MPGDADGRVTLAQRSIDPGLATNDSRLARYNVSTSPALRFNQASGQVASAHVFSQGTSDVGSGQRGHRKF